jgi:hypothetical protein
MLDELHFGYASYTVVILAGSVTGFLSSRWWGGLGDEFGNRAVLRWTVVGMSVLPLLWLVSGSVPWLLVMNVAGAFLWSGLNLSAVNFLYDACSAAGVAFRSWVREVREVRQIGLREVMLDFVGQRLEQVLGLFSVQPELESRRAHRRRGRRSGRRATPAGPR